jgi:hypothetical protein
MRRAARIGMLVLICVLSAVGSSYGESSGTPTAERVTSHLTGGSQRAWVATPWKQVLAERTPRCERGEIWTFSHDGKGVKRICVNGVARDEQFRWAWVGAEGDLPVLKVDETRYVVELRQEKANVQGYPPVLVTILRSLRTRQDDPVNEITLKFQDL